MSLDDGDISQQIYGSPEGHNGFPTISDSKHSVIVAQRPSLPDANVQLEPDRQ